MKRPAILATFVFTLAAATTQAQPVSIGTLGGNSSYGTSINAAGQVVGWSDNGGSPNEQHAFLWTPATPNGTAGTMIDLGKLGGVYSDAQGINDPGQIVGLTNMPSAGDRAYVWTPTTPNGTTGVMVSIGVLGTGWSSQGNGINNAGQVVGWSYWTNDPTDGHDNEQHAFLWTPAVPNGSTGAMVDLGTLGGPSSTAMAISADGKVAGWSDTADGAIHAFLWTPGGTAGPPSNPQMQDLGTLPGGLQSLAYGVNSFGQVSGSSFDAGSPLGFLWTPGGTAGSADNPQMQDLGSLGGGVTLATGLTETGAVTGATVLSGNAGTHAFLWIPEEPNATVGAMVDAGVLSGSGAVAYSINMFGQIAGYGDTDCGCGNVYAFVTPPAETPSNHAPTADDKNVSVQKDRSIVIGLTGTDTDSDPLTYIIVTPPAHGTLTGTGASRTYKPAHGYLGPDSFTYKVNDGHADSAAAAVSIAVTFGATNKAPAAKKDDVNLAKNQSALTIDVLSNDTDVDHDVLTIESVAQGTRGIAAIVVVGGAQQIQYDANSPRAKGGTKDTFSYTISDGHGGTSTANVTVTYK